MLFKGIWKFRQVRILANGVIDIVSGGKLKLAGTEVTPTATELNYVKDVTSAIQAQVDAKVAKATYTAHTILQATTSATPVALTVAEQTLVGRKTGANIAALAGADALLAMGISALVAELNKLAANYAVMGGVRTQQWAAPAAAAAAAVHALIVLTGSEQDITTEITNPDFPRVLSITSPDATATGNVVISGTNIDDESITDTIALNGAATVDGVCAFKTVTNIHLPVTGNGDDEVSIGISVKLGLDKLLPNYSGGAIDTVLMAAADGVYEATRPTVVADADEVEKNTISFNSAPDASKDLIAVFITAA